MKTVHWVYIKLHYNSVHWYTYARIYRQKTNWCEETSENEWILLFDEL